MVGPITGPSDSYNPVNPTLSSIDADLATAQSSYDTAQSNVTTAYNDYSTSKTNLITVVNNPGSTQTDIDNAYQDFDTKRAAYYATLEDFKTAASHLIDVKGYRLQYLDDTTASLVSSLVSEFSTLLSTGIISSALYNSLSGALSDLTQAQINVRNTLNNLMDNEPLIAEARIQYIELDDEGFIAQLQGDTATYNQRQTDKANKQTELDSLVATRDSLYSSLATYMGDFTTAYTNLQTFLHQEGATDLPATIDNFNTQLDQSIQDEADLMLLLQQQIEATDQLTESAYLISHPSVDGSVESAIDAAQQASKILTEKILSSGLSSFTPTQINLPVLPSAGVLSINDLMRFITRVQIYIQQLLSNIQLADSRLRELRLKLINAESASATFEAGARTSQLDALTASDTAYDEQVIMDNLERYYAAVHAVDNYNSVINEINAKINDFNSGVDQFNQNTVDVITQINAIAPNITTTTGYATTVPPASVNDLDILNVETAYPDIGSTIANPGTVNIPPPEKKLPLVQPLNIPVPPYDETVGQVPTFDQYQEMLIKNLPPKIFTTTTPPSQNELDQFNQAITEINSTLAPIIDQLGGDPINFTPIEPLVYRDSITIRTSASLFDIATFLGSLSGLQGLLFNLIFGAILRKGLENKSFLLNSPTLFGPLSAPETAKTRTEGVGSGVGITGANYLAPPSKVQSIITTALSTEDFRNSVNRFLELAGLTAGLQASIRLPSEFRNYSVMGQVRSDRVQQTQAAKDQATSVVASDEAAKNLLSFSGDVGLLTIAAKELLAALSAASEASAEEIKQLLALLVFLQQLVLILIAAATGLIGGGATTPAELANGIRNLFGGTQGATVLGTNDASINVAGILSSGGFSAPSTNAVVGLLSGTGNNVNNITILNQNGYTLPITNPQNPDFIKELLNQTDEQLDQQQRAALADVLAKSLRQLGIRQEDIDRFNQQAQSGQKLGDAYTSSLKNAPSSLVQGLGTTSQSASPSQSAPISAGASALGNNFSSLSATDKATFLSAINTGALSPQQSGLAVGALLRIDNQGATPENVQNLSQAVSGTAPATPIPSTPTEFQNAFNGTFARIFNDPATQRYVRDAAENFANLIERQTSFSKFSVDFVLDPAKSILKNFSIATQEGTGPSAQTPNIIPV